MANETKGILGEKLGMTQVWDEANRLIPVTVVKAGPCVVTQVRTPDKDGYELLRELRGTLGKDERSLCLQKEMIALEHAHRN